MTTNEMTCDQIRLMVTLYEGCQPNEVNHTLDKTIAELVTKGALKKPSPFEDLELTERGINWVNLIKQFPIPQEMPCGICGFNLELGELNCVRCDTENVPEFIDVVCPYCKVPMHISDAACHICGAGE